MNLSAKRINLWSPTSLISPLLTTLSTTTYCLISSTSSSVNSGYFILMIFGIKTLLITSASIVPDIVFNMLSSCSIVAFKSFKSASIISLTLFELGSLKPLTLIVPGSASSSLSSFVLNLKLGANTCSINKDAVIAFSISLVAFLTSSCIASGCAIKFVN